ncbi:hypothetical protein F5Y13DRAFT_75906 [Hypoxylon sp. FL1857]|nr:hypothetical protein F5Y13DRAFT_75906 [Hypoxylon sp. FL1857]
MRDGIGRLGAGALLIALQGVGGRFFGLGICTSAVARVWYRKDALLQSAIPWYLVRRTKPLFPPLNRGVLISTLIEPEN